MSVETFASAVGASGRRLAGPTLTLLLAATLGWACGGPTPSTSPATAASPSASPTAVPATPTAAAMSTPAPPTQPPAVGLAAIAPGRPYAAGAEFRPRLEYDGDVLDEPVQGRLLASAAEAIETVTGAPYVDVVATFTCTGTPICQLKVEGWVADANNADTWYWDVGRNGSRFELETGPDPVTTWLSVPLFAVADLLEIVALDPRAADRASEYYAMSYAAWYPGQPHLLSLTYSLPAGGSTQLLTIVIDIVERRVVDYLESVLDL